jgi:hypothetical protein
MSISAAAAIDWGRLATPDDDQYDTRIALTLLTGAGRQPQHTLQRTTDAESICEGRVMVCHLDLPEMSPPHFQLAPLDHPNLRRAVAYLRSWPAIYAQFTALVDTVHPCLDPNIRPAYREISTGSSSHSYADCSGLVCVTVDHPIGAAQGLVRELAHHKLWALGIAPPSAAAGGAGVSPSEEALPPTLHNALHAQYALLYVTALDIMMLRAETDIIARDQILQLLLRNVVRLEASCAPLLAQEAANPHAAVFIAAVLNWANHIIKRGYKLLDDNGYETYWGQG